MGLGLEPVEGLAERLREGVSLGVEEGEGGREAAGVPEGVTPTGTEG